MPLLPPSWKKKLLVPFGSLQLAITLLLLVACASSIGTVLPQDQGPAVIEKSTFAPPLKSLLLGIQAYDVYHAVWFNALLAALFLNLSVCTYLRFPPTWRRYAMAMPPAPPVASLPESVALQSPPDAMRLDLLRKRGYRVQALPTGGYFLEKNKFVRLGPTVIHLSLFAILAGAILGGLTGMKSDMPLMVGQKAGIHEAYQRAVVKGPLFWRAQPFDVSLEAFRIDFRPNGMVKQYYSDVTITSRDGSPPTRATLWVNEPLVHGGVTFYQSFWGVGGLTYTLDGKSRAVQVLQVEGGYMSRPFAVGDTQYVVYMRGIEQPALVINVKTVKPEAQLVPGIPVKLNGKPLQIEGYHLYSGLEVKQDPGIPIVYIGCGLLIFGLALVPFSHRELWIRAVEDGWVLAGRTGKGRLMMRREMADIARVWSSPAIPFETPDIIGARAS